MAVFLSAAACAIADQGRIEGRWLLDSVAVDGVFLDLDPALSSRNDMGVPAWFDFDNDATFEGSGPCNDISGSYEFDGTRLAGIDPIHSAVGCSTADVTFGDFMAFEELVFDALDGVEVHFSSDIRMQWQGDNAIVTFRRQP